MPLYKKAHQDPSQNPSQSQTSAAASVASSSPFPPPPRRIDPRHGNSHTGDILRERSDPRFTSPEPTTKVAYNLPISITPAGQCCSITNPIPKHLRPPHQLHEIPPQLLPPRIARPSLPLLPGPALQGPQAQGPHRERDPVRGVCVRVEARGLRVVHHRCRGAGWLDEGAVSGVWEGRGDGKGGGRTRKSGGWGGRWRGGVVCEG